MNYVINKDGQLIHLPMTAKFQGNEFKVASINFYLKLALLCEDDFTGQRSVSIKDCEFYAYDKEGNKILIQLEQQTS